jgi:hypothetical protein
MENIHGRVEPLYPTVNVLCAFSAGFWRVEGVSARYVNLPEILTHIHLAGILSCESAGVGVLFAVRGFTHICISEHRVFFSVPGYVA